MVEEVEPQTNVHKSGELPFSGSHSSTIGDSPFRFYLRDQIGGADVGTRFQLSDFELATTLTKERGLSRPSLSYWNDAWRRLRRNKQALASMLLLSLITLFVTVGPFIWGIDPHTQNLGRVSAEPSLGEDAVVLGELAPFEVKVDSTFPEVPSASRPADQLEIVKNLRLISQATTQAVRLEWEPVEGAASYILYRNEVNPQGSSRGVPIGETQAGNQISIEDNLSLEPKTYYYTVVARNASGEESTQAQTIIVDVKPSIPLEQIRLSNPEVTAGQSVRLEPAPLGTDGLGRDILARLMYGGRISLFIGVAATALYIFAGIVIGGIAGFVGGKVDMVLMRITDFVTGLPFLLVMILLKVVLNVDAGESGILALIIALIALSWTGQARLVRGQVLQLRESEFVHAARLVGARTPYIIARHLLPNLMGVILVSLTSGIPITIFTEAFLSFIGLGVASPAASWGSLCTESVQTLFNRPYEFFFPAICISLTVLGFNLLGDGLRDALDPKLRAQE